MAQLSGLFNSCELTPTRLVLSLRRSVLNAITPSCSAALTRHGHPRSFVPLGRRAVTAAKLLFVVFVRWMIYSSDNGHVCLNFLCYDLPTFLFTLWAFLDTPTWSVIDAMV